MKKNILWNTIGNFAYTFAQWLITILVVYIASYKEAGYLSLAMTTSSSFSAITLFSMRNYQVSDVTNEFSPSEYIGSRIVTCFAGFLCCIIGAIPGNNWYQRICIYAFMLTRVAESFSDVCQGEDQRFERYDLIGKSCLLRAITTIGSFFLIMSYSKNLFLSLMIMALCNFAIVFLFDWRKVNELEYVKPIIWNANINKLLKRCFPIVAFTFLLNLINLIPKNVLQKVMGTEILGYYSSMASPTLVVQVLASMIFTPFIPRIANAYNYNDKNAVKRMLKKTYLFLLLTAIVSVIGGMAIGKIGLRILYGTELLKYYNYFFLIILCTVMLAAVWILYSIAVAMRKIKEIIIGMIISFAVMTATVFPLTIRFGMNGTSLAQIVGYGIFLQFVIIIFGRSLRDE
jgi:O-antigen/teichoic acid export membrane protein